MHARVRRQVREPLDVLEKHGSRARVVSIVFYTTNMCEVMDRMTKTELHKAQMEQKQYYDKNTRTREEDLVFVTDIYCHSSRGQYHFKRKVGKVNFNMADRSYT